MNINPFSGKIMAEIEQAKLDITGGRAEFSDLWILLERISEHLRRVDRAQEQLIRALELAADDKLNISNGPLVPGAKPKIKYIWRKDG